MRKYGKSTIISSLAVFSVALTFVAIHSLEAKKPPKREWKVAIPNELLAADVNYSYNLYGNPHGGGVPSQKGYITYENNEVVEVDFWTDEDRQTGKFSSVFSLVVENTDKGGVDPGFHSVGIRELAFIGCRSHCYLGGDSSIPCYAYGFPNFLGTHPHCCKDCGSDLRCCPECFPPTCPDCVPPECVPPSCKGEGCCEEGVCCSHDRDVCSSLGYTGHWVMEQFMEGYAHPSQGYDHFSLRFWVDTDIESIGIGSDKAVQVEGYIQRLNVWNTDTTLVHANDDYHNLVVKPWPLTGVLVERLNENEWIITIDQNGETGSKYIPFHETYYQEVEKKRGKSGKSYTSSEYLWAIGAATPFKFVTIWTRSS